MKKRRDCVMGNGSEGWEARAGRPNYFAIVEQPLGSQAGKPKLRRHCVLRYVWEAWEAKAGGRLYFAILLRPLGSHAGKPKLLRGRGTANGKPRREA